MADNDKPWENDTLAPQPDQTQATSDKPWEHDQEYKAPATSDDPEIKKLVENSPGIKDANTWEEALSAGWQHSASGLLQKKPNMQLPEHASFAHGLLNDIGELAGDTPFYVGGFFAGGAAAGGAAAETGPADVVIAPTAGLIAAGATPEAVRQVMTDVYSDDKPHTAADISRMIAKNVWETTKAGALNLIGGKGAGMAEKIAVRQGGGMLARSAANIGGFTVSATAANATLNGQMPDWNDFGRQALLGLGMHVLGHVSQFKSKPTGTFTVGDTVVQGDEKAFNQVRDNLKSVYANSGIPPWEAIRRAQSDPKLRDEILGQDVNGDAVAPKFHEQAEPEPEPFKTNAFKIADEHQQEVTGIEGEAVIRGHVEKKLMPLVRGLEQSADDAVSPAGAMGRYQIMPGTARQYGFDPSRLFDPGYNETVARTILTDLTRRFHGDTEAILIAYNAGPGAAWRYLRHGSDKSELPQETQRYLVHAGQLDPETARIGGGGKGGPPAPPEKPAGTEEPEGGNWRSAPDETLRSRFQNRIGEEPDIETKMPHGFEFELDGLRSVDRTLAKAGLYNPETDAGNEDMARMTYGSENRASHFFQYGPVDAVTFEKQEGPSLKDVRDEIEKAGGNISDFSRYALSLRSIEKAKQGIDMGLFKPGEAEENVRRLNVDYGKANEMFQKFNDSALKYGRDSGLLSDDAVARMKEANTSYMSIRRIMGDNKAFEIGSKSKFFKTTNPLRKMEGDDRDIRDPWAATMDNVRLIIQRADRNRFATSLVDSTASRAALGLKLISHDPKQFIAEPGSDIFKPYSITPEQEAAVAPLAVKATGRGGRNFVIYRNGKPEMWEAKDDETARLIRGAESPGEMNLLTKIAMFPTKLERAGIVGDPTFGFRVGLKHQTFAWWQDPTHPPPVITMMRGALSVLGKDDAYQEALRNGAFTGVITDMDRAFNQHDVLEQTGALQKTWNAFRHPIEFAHAITEFLTSSARLGYIKRAQNLGYSDFKASMNARKAYIDYQEQMTASWANTMARWVPFFRPAMFTIKLAKEAATERPVESAAYAVGGIMLTQIGMYALNRMADQSLPPGQRYTDLPQYERDQFYITPPIGGIRFRLGRPFVLGPLLGVPMERLLNYMWDKDPHAFDDVLGEMFDAAPPIFPTIAKPGMEYVSNHNFFTGRPLVSDAARARTRDLQYTDYTSEVAKKVAEVTGGHDETGVGLNSPPVIDNFAREWGGTIGLQVLHALDAPLGGSKAPWTTADTPFVGSFFARNPGMSSQPIDDFYKTAEQYEALHQDVSFLAKHGREDEAIQTKGEVGQKAVIAMHIQKALGMMRGAISAINDNKKMSTDDKRQLTDRITADAIKFAEFGSKVLKDQGGDMQESQQLSDQAEGDLEKAQPQQ